MAKIIIKRENILLCSLATYTVMLNDSLFDKIKNR